MPYENYPAITKKDLFPRVGSVFIGSSQVTPVTSPFPEPTPSFFPGGPESEKEGCIFVQTVIYSPNCLVELVRMKDMGWYVVVSMMNINSYNFFQSNSTTPTPTRGHTSHKLRWSVEGDVLTSFPFASKKHLPKEEDSLT